MSAEITVILLMLYGAIIGFVPGYICGIIHEVKVQKRLLRSEEYERKIEKKRVDKMRRKMERQEANEREMKKRLERIESGRKK